MLFRSGPIIIAQENGYFAEQDLEVEIIAPANAADPPKLVAAGKFDLAISYQPQLHLQVHAGLPLVRVGTLIATPLNCLLVLDEGPIRSIADLKGRKIGYSVAGVEEALLTAILGRYDLSLADVELVNVNWSLSPALMSGQVEDRKSTRLNSRHALISYAVFCLKKKKKKKTNKHKKKNKNKTYKH